MERERFEPQAGPRPRMSEAARADVEALRASDRLQRIFEAAPGRARPIPEPGSDLRADARSAPRRSPARLDGGEAPPGRGGLLASRRRRVLVGLTPLYLAVAVLAAEGLSRLDTGADHAPVAAAGRMPAEAPSAKAGAIPTTSRQAAAKPVAAAGGAARGAPAHVGQAAPSPAASAVTLEAVPRPAPRPTGHGQASMQASAGPSAEGERASPPVAGNGQEPAPAPRGHRSEAGTAAESGAGKAADDLAKAVSRAVEPGAGAAVSATAATGATDAAAGRRPAAAELSDRPARGADAAAGSAELPKPETASEMAGGSEPGSEVVPQATWSGPAASPPPARRAAEAPREAQRTARDDIGPASEPQPTYGPHARTSAQARIVLHYSGDRGASAARRLADELRARGVGRTELRPVPFAVSRANVRYFHDQNLPVARAVNGLLRAMGRRSDLRDFTHYAPSPSVGTVEVWLPG